MEFKPGDKILVPAEVVETDFLSTKLSLDGPVSGHTGERATVGVFTDNLVNAQLVERPEPVAHSIRGTKQDIIAVLREVLPPYTARELAVKLIEQLAVEIEEPSPEQEMGEAVHEIAEDDTITLHVTPTACRAMWNRTYCEGPMNAAVSDHIGKNAIEYPVTLNVPRSALIHYRDTNTALLDIVYPGFAGTIQDALEA